MTSPITTLEALTPGIPRRVRQLLARLTGDEKHSPAAHSTLDVLWVLYDRVLHIDPDDPAAPNRDRFLLSKGHGPAAYYAVLAARGFIDPDLLDGFGEYDSSLGHHPDRLLIPGVEFSSGSLGHGLPVAVGTALALRALGSPARVYVLLGDGELDEGSNHEAIAAASRLALGSLTAIVLDNGSSSLGWPGSIGDRFGVEGWQVATIDGRDHDAIADALTRRSSSDSPRAVVTEVTAR
jgi:transketolase